MPPSPYIKAYKYVNISLPPTERIKALYEELAHDPEYDGYDVMGLKQCEFVSCDEKTGSVVCFCLFGFMFCIILCSELNLYFGVLSKKCICGSGGRGIEKLERM